MKGSDRMVLVALLTLLIWATFTWPLPRYVESGIPWTARTPEPATARFMVPGDHLQLLYHFWLLADMLRGRTPWFTNLYEFNTGDDDARRKVDPYYVPFSLVYAAGQRLGGQAFGWNLAGLVALGLALGWTWALTRRYTPDDGLALAATLTATTLPFPWVNLLGGSPAGFAMAFVPALLLGLDLAVRDERPAGGLLAGLALLGAACTDLHVFFFSALAAPGWCVVAGFSAPRLPWVHLRAGLRVGRALLPALVLAATALAVARTASAHLDASGMAGGRSLREVAGYSPHPVGLVSSTSRGASSQVYVGWGTLALLALGLVVFLARAPRQPRAKWRTLVVALLLFFACGKIMVLALGVNGPAHGALFRLGRHLVPPYAFVRQPAKIFCLLPSFLAPALALTLTALLAGLRRQRWRWATACVVALLLLADHRRQLRPGICLLDREQPAYAAIADAARQAGKPPRALALPLWPGDSHWSSLYEHYAARYRIRMVNGYSPTVSTNYVAAVFRHLESANLGELTDAQLNTLAAWGVDHLLLHEDAFPEKVSPYPVGFTLQRLRRHPRLELLCQHRSVWAFRILSSPRPVPPATPPHDTVISAARLWEVEAPAESRAVAVRHADDLSRGACAVFDQPESMVRLRPTALTAAPHQRFLIRARGPGRVRFGLETDQALRWQETISLTDDRWTWEAVPAPPTPEHVWVTPVLAHASGSVAVDVVILAAGGWSELRPGERRHLPATAFFHAGHTELTDDSVVLDALRDPAGVIFYGLNLPLAIGEYRGDLLYETAAPGDSTLGRWFVTGSGLHSPGVEVRAGRPAVLLFKVEHALPVRLNFDYFGTAGLRIQGVDLTRLQ